ncbi:MAG: glycine--tRNA ligase subunit beta, partial [Gammaproteobacteria bacterium]|nr:glycine--tRNA ligase subunit beta [Gammaproteobacteria bacterium]
ADKLDTLVGVFGIGQIPTGEKDPYALRRAALGVLRTLIEGNLDLDLTHLIRDAAGGYTQQQLADGVQAAVFEFIIDRLRAYFADQGIPAEVFQAVQARQPRRPLDFARRAQAVNAFRQLAEAQSLVAANKRIQNILRQVDHDLPNEVDDALFRADAEWDLAAKMVGLRPRVLAMLKQSDYTGALTSLAGLRDAVDAFFDNVRVMDEDVNVKNNRLALLNNISELFLATADISKLQA